MTPNEMKIQPNELRIGNIIGRRWINQIPNQELTEELCPVRVHAIGETQLNTDVSMSRNERYKADYSMFAPIPLTEELLLMFGFEKLDGRWFKGGDEPFEIYDDLKFGKQLIYDGVNIKHVHQLQNLYFALTGQELTLNQELK